MIALLHNIRSAHNVGSIFRTADAAGIKKLYLCGITPSPLDEFGRVKTQLAKVSLGAEKNVPWDKIKSTARLLDKLILQGYSVYAIEQSSRSTSYLKMSVGKKRIALVLGNEVRGLPKAILDKANAILEIPMRGAVVRQSHHPRRSGRGKESLNVAVAFGIIAFRFAK